MRAMPVATLNNFRQHRDPVVMGKIAYVVDSRAEWIADAKGSTDCTANGAAADYLKITSTVVGEEHPAQAHRGHEHRHPGARHVHRATRAASRCRSSAPTARAAPASTSRSTARPATASCTDANGCAFFGYEPVGGYNVTASASGYVDPNGNANATGTSSVGSQTVATLSLTYDLAGQATAQLRDRPRRPPRDRLLPGLGGLLQRRRDHQQRRALLRRHGMPTGDHHDADAVPVPGRLQRVRGRLRQQRPRQRASRPTRSRSCPASSTTRSRSTCRRSTCVTQLNGANKAGMYVLIKSTTAGCTPKHLSGTDLERQLPPRRSRASRSAPTPSASTTASRPSIVDVRARSRRRSRSTR